MKSLRLLALSLLACTCAVSFAYACDNGKSATSSTTASVVSSKVPGSVPKDGGCSAEAITYKTAATGGQCSAHGTLTAAQKEACAARMAALAKAGGCPYHSMSGASTAVTASAGGTCSAHGNAATLANGAACPHSTSGAATAAGLDHCSAAKASAASLAATGMMCAGHRNAVAHDCSACDDWADCERKIEAMGAKAQVVALKNGAMIVYTADTPADIRALQSLVAKRNEHMIAALSAGSDQKLCDECKQLRGAMASGKLHREVVNVDRGCMTLITSNDRAVVQKIRTMTGQPVAMR